MLVLENESAVQLVCGLCGEPILPGQPYITRNNLPIHSESDDCDPDEGWDPEVDGE